MRGREHLVRARELRQRDLVAAIRTRGIIEPEQLGPTPLELLRDGRDERRGLP